MKSEESAEQGGDRQQWRILAEWTVASKPGNERQVMEQVAFVVGPLLLPSRRRRLEGLKTAVAEATMNAMEHGNQYRSDKPVILQVPRGWGLFLINQLVDEMRVMNEGHIHMIDLIIYNCTPG